MEVKWNNQSIAVIAIFTKDPFYSLLLTNGTSVSNSVIVNIMVIIINPCLMSGMDVKQ